MLNITLILKGRGLPSLNIHILGFHLDLVVVIIKEWTKIHSRCLDRDEKSLVTRNLIMLISRRTTYSCTAHWRPTSLTTEPPSLVLWISMIGETNINSTAVLGMNIDYMIIFKKRCYF